MSFGKEKAKKGKIPDWNFDLEMDLKDPAKLRKTKDEIEVKIQQLKGWLREGGDKASFDKGQILLHGFLAAQKVINRIGR